MADEVATADTKPATADPKLQVLVADAQRKVDPPAMLPADQKPSAVSLKPGSVPEGFVPQTDPPREVPAAERLRAFEDEHLGKGAVRIGGKIERGFGSPFAALSDEKKRQYAALEKLAGAEQKLADAHTALIQAEADHEAALAAAEPKLDASE